MAPSHGGMRRAPYNGVSIRMAKLVASPGKFLAALTLLLMSSVSLARGFDDRYTAAVGDLNADGLQDIYIRQKPRIVPIALDDITVPIPLQPPVAPFVLQRRADGRFDIVSSLTSQQRTALAAWTASTSIRLFTSDLNVDGFKDLIVKGIGGSPAATDQIVFANVTDGKSAYRVRAIDAQLAGFFKDAYRWANNPQYFELASLVNGWYQRVLGPPRTDWWPADYLQNWSYTDATGVLMISADEDPFDNSRTLNYCTSPSQQCRFNDSKSVWEVYYYIRPITPVYDNFYMHFNATAVDLGVQNHDSIRVLIDIIAGQLEIPVGGGEKVLTANEDELPVEEQFWNDLLLRILLHDNYCAITLECSVDIVNVSQFDMIVERLGTGSYYSAKDCKTHLNYTHGSYQVTATNGTSLIGFTLERGGPDSTEPADIGDKCTNKPKRVPEGSYTFTLNGTNARYPNVPRLETTAIQRSAVLVHNAWGAAGSIGCILVSKTSGASGVFSAGRFPSGKAASEAAIAEIRKAIVYDTNKFVFGHGTVQIRNNGH
jgi:hypothetical protein